MDKKRPKLYGLLAKFDNPEDLVAAAKRVVQAGYQRFDAYAPYPVEELSHAMHLKPSPLPYVILIGGILGGVGGFFMQTYATVVDLPLNIGGRPLFSWPTYIPITFELIILIGALAGVLGLFAVTRFPQPYHPLFNSEDFVEHGSSDSFYLDIEASDPNFDLERTHRFMQELGAIQVNEIEA
jgi:H+/Cl- antiporter ClcA